MLFKIAKVISEKLNKMMGVFVVTLKAKKFEILITTKTTTTKSPFRG
jgi:hypothetical protein